MSRKAAIETEEMLRRLERAGVARSDAESLRRISMTLHRWHEMECNADIQRFIPKRVDGKRVYIVAEESGFPYVVDHDPPCPPRYTRIPDRERGALKRLKAIMACYPALSVYVQGDPRGASLYILRPGDVPDGESVDAYYSRGLAVFK